MTMTSNRILVYPAISTTRKKATPWSLTYCRRSPAPTLSG
jgi:hypothetical protein